jgi:LexA-binding, inner membrane-associated putative hydrolase
MSPITHFLASWSLADVTGLRGRDQALVTWCGVAPDLDGLGVVVDLANSALGRPESWHYGRFHHALLHGLPAAIAIPLMLALFATNRLRMFLVGVAAVHLHFLCDIVGSRGPGVGDVWPLAYLAPFSQRSTVQWAGQWPLNAWPNIAFTLVLIAYAFHRAVEAGYSPVGVFSKRADRAFVETVQARWRALRT